MRKIKRFLIESNAIENVWDDASYQKANSAWLSLMKCDELTPEKIKHIHLILMEGKLISPEIGEWRTCPVYIGGHTGKPWYAIPELIHAWCERTKNYKSAKDLQRAHVEFEHIHPFIDGNGRVGRMLWQWQRVKRGLPIKIIYEAKKWDYYKWFDPTL